MEMSFKIRFVHQKQSNNIIKLTFDACIPILMENTRIFTPKSAQTIRTPFGAQIKENPDFRLKSRKIWIFQIFEAVDRHCEHILGICALIVTLNTSNDCF